MQYSNCWLSLLDYIGYPFTFYLCKFTGIFPSWVNGEGFTIQSLFQTAAGLRVARTTSKVVYFYGFVFIFFNSLVAFTYYVEDYATNRYHLYMAIADSIPAYLVIFISVIARRHSTVECIYSASLRYCMSPPCMKSCALIFITVLFYFLVLMCGFICSLYFVDSNEHNVFFLLLNEFSFSPLFATCLLVSSLCLIAERVFIYINGQLREISKMRYPEKTISQIEILMFYHEVATDFVEEINICFSYDLITLLLDFTHQLIFCSYTMTLLSQTNINSMLILGLLYSVRLFKFLMVCSCSKRIQKQVNLLRVHIQSIKVNYLHQEDPRLTRMLTDFSKAANERTAILCAAGFTDIDFNLVFKLTGTAVMYACAALQYNGLTK